MVIKIILSILGVIFYFSALFFAFRFLSVELCIRDIDTFNKYAPTEDKIIIPRKFKDRLKLYHCVQVCKVLLRYDGISQLNNKFEEMIINDQKKI